MRGGRLWQGVLHWWRAARNEASGPKSARSSLHPVSGHARGWSTRPLAAGEVRTSARRPDADASSAEAPSLEPATADEVEAARERIRAHGWALEAGTMPEPGLDFEATEEELLEFLAADQEPVEADPKFKASLREQLWELVEEEGGTRH